MDSGHAREGGGGRAFHQVVAEEDGRHASQHQRPRKQNRNAAPARTSRWHDLSTPGDDSQNRSPPISRGIALPVASETPTPDALLIAVWGCKHAGILRAPLAMELRSPFVQSATFHTASALYLALMVA